MPHIETALTESQNTQQPPRLNPSLPLSITHTTTTTAHIAHIASLPPPLTAYCCPSAMVTSTSTAGSMLI